MPPTTAPNLGFSAFIPQVLQNGDVTVTIDSVVPGSWLSSVRAATYWFTGQGAGAPVQFSATITGSGTSSSTDATGSAGFLATAMDSAAAAQYGGDNTYSLYGSVSIKVNGDYRYTNKARAAVNGDPDGNHNGPRWWAGAANENTDDPNGINCLTINGENSGNYNCTLTDFTRNAGALPGVDSLFWISSYVTSGASVPPRDIEGITSSVFRAADFKFYWGANGAVDSVVDVTHHVPVQFKTNIRASWGILNDSSFVNTAAANTPDGDNAILTWQDYACVAPVPTYLNRCGGAAGTPAVFMDHARLSPVAVASSGYGTAQAATGNGFILYLNGEFFMMQMTALPAAGTVWNLRQYAGNITGVPGSFEFQGATRPAAVPGLRLRIAYTGSSVNSAVTADSLLARVHTVPDPYYVTNQLEITANTKVLRFVNLPSQAIIRIYSVSGILVNILTHNDPTGGGEEVWNLRNRNNQFVASGVYFYHVETPDGRKKIGRFTVVNYAQ
jgi:hypothetical protein